MRRPRIIAATLLAAGAVALAGTALAGVVKKEHRHETTIANADGDTAWVRVDRGPRLHIVTRDADRDEPDVIDLDLSDLGRVISDAMREVSRSLQDVHVRTVGPEGDEHIIVDANGKRTDVDLGRIMRDVNREVSGALRDLNRDRTQERLRHREIIAEHRAQVEQERAELQAQMDQLRDEIDQMRQDLAKMRGREGRRD
jgi:multidrug resistance efflux pump